MPVDSTKDDLEFDYFVVPRLSLRGRLAIVVIIAVLLVAFTAAIRGRGSADSYDSDVSDAGAMRP